MMERHICQTGDGSPTIFDPRFGEYFHSGAGAMGESMHVFIQNGLKVVLGRFDDAQINVLEYGFGTGLNALLTLVHAAGKMIRYTAVDKFPLREELWGKLPYGRLLNPPKEFFYEQLMACSWNRPCNLHPAFTLLKLEADVLRFEPQAETFHLVYFDAFSPKVQPDLWSVEIFTRLYDAMCRGGVLVTYSARGSVKQALRQAKFTLERLPGFAGKRHMLRATKA